MLGHALQRASVAVRLALFQIAELVGDANDCGREVGIAKDIK